MTFTATKSAIFRHKDFLPQRAQRTERKRSGNAPRRFAVKNLENPIIILFTIPCDCFQRVKIRRARLKGKIHRNTKNTEKIRSGFLGVPVRSECEFQLDAFAKNQGTGHWGPVPKIARVYSGGSSTIEPGVSVEAQSMLSAT